METDSQPLSAALFLQLCSAVIFRLGFSSSEDGVCIFQGCVRLDFCNSLAPCRKWAISASLQCVIILVGRSCARPALSHQCPLLSAERSGVCWRLGPESNIVELSGPGRSSALEEDLSLNKVKC